MKYSGRRGFTLIEVLIALVIVALAAAAAMEAVSGAADTTVSLRDRSFAQWIALNRIAEQRVEAAPASSGETKGEVEFAGRRWQWRQTSEPLALASLRRIDVSVRLAGLATATPSAESDQNYLVTVTGVLGSDVAAPRGDTPDWEPVAPPAGTPNPNSNPANPTVPPIIPGSTGSGST